MSAGMKFAFEEANRAGGIMSRNITLVARDDGYNVTKAMDNIYQLLDVDNVLLLAGVVGSDIVDQAKPLILQRRVPYVGPYSGLASLHTPFHEEFVNIRASFNDEVVAQATFLVQYSRVQRIACLYQDDSFGITGRSALVDALANVGLELVASGSYTVGNTDVEEAVEAIAAAPRKPQAVVLIALQNPLIKFINLHVSDARTDPDCIYTVMSPGWGTSFSKEFNRTLWDRVYFFFVVPLTRDPSWAISRHFTAVYTGTSGTIAFEGYIVGRFIVEVLKRIRSTNVTSAMFLDEVYSTRMFVLDDLVVGMYSSNYSGCSQALCSCNSGLRSVYTAQLDTSVSGYLRPGLATIRYSVLECSSPISNVIAPLLFGQLLPGWDDGWRAVALDIGRGIRAAFAEANAGGGAGGREFVLLQQNYSNAKATAQNMTNRYPLAAMLGSVVPNTSLVDAPIPSLGNFETKVAATNAAFSRDEVRVQPAASLELMALANWATQRCTAVHLRATSTDTGRQLLRVMTQSVESFQRRAASTSTYSAVSDVLSSTQEGCVIAIGSDEAIVSWYNALPQYPHLHLLTLSRLAMCLMAVLPNASSLSQASRLHFPTIITDQWNTTVSNTEYSEPWKYGYVLGQAVVSTLVHSQYAYKSYTTPAELLKAWYTVRVMTSGAVTLGPYDGENCTAGLSECECNEGVRSVAIRSLSSSDVEDLYSISTCHVVYTAFLESSSNAATMAAIVGAVVGFFGVAAVGVGLYWLRTRRNHSAAPKDAHKPFCILFTDIQASTHLWATVPDIMAPALSTHHALIRQAIAKHHCYEVKTIGDSFMCAVRTPQQAVRLALAIQNTLHDHHWDTAIDRTYIELLETNEVGRVSSSCWNGLRVRVGIHHGLGDIQFDAVTKAYDYYGTVVNTAARIENVCHGGQIGVSQEVYDVVKDSITDVVWSDLGCQSLRGLADCLHLYQVLPVGPLASRTFPALRLDKQSCIQATADVDLEVTVTSHHSSAIASQIKSNSIAPSTSNVTVEDWKWVETHPLVLHGDVCPEELKRLYTIAYSTLSTLLTTQTEKFRQHVVHGLCERLHVTNYGVKGPTLHRTLRGLVHRVLPATVMNAQQLLQKSCLTRQNSKLTLPTSPLLPDVISVGY
eukprot:GGOE01035944.1.p1 GENE.GGOE01035944.1~~GGOE01035944.1.p1  ORF type:complete len:1181 (-),score=399.66 GGOE01035944.1:658-4059(-)